MKQIYIIEEIEDDLDFYAENRLDLSVEDDEISGLEEGFMMGYLR